MFDADRLIEECQAAVAENDSHMAVKQIVERAVSDPAAVLKGLGEPTRAGVNRLFVSDKLTVLNLVWGPMMTLKPHDHKMWAVIGIYTGREDNIFWRKLKDEPNRIEAAGAEALGTGDCAPLGRDVVHSVTNPLPRLTGALHVYGGDFFGDGRSEWDPETLTEQPYDIEGNLQLFEDSNARLDAA
ncbi:MAG: hypothetical protein OXR84_02865 [Magnetovibrio sp.]|nr:hypothetical protein [Magnetovibrio sp.]